MNKEKRNIAKKLETESKYLTNILDKQDVKEFKKLIPELQDTWKKKQMFRTETEKWDGSSWAESGDLNTARTELGALGQQTLALAFGGNGGSVTAATEIYNGTSWTELNDLSTARQRIALGPAGSSAAGLAAGGYAGSDPGVANTEEWTAPTTLSTVTVS